MTPTPLNFVGDWLTANTGLGSTFAQPIGGAVILLAVSAVVYVLGRAVATPLVNRVLERRGLDEHAKRPIRKVTSLVVLFVAVGVGFAMAGFGNILTAIATIGAAATLAIGFAMQDVLANFVAGVFIYTDKPFRIGDWIQWDGNEGVVEDISMRVSRVRTFDNELLTVPNANLTDGVIKNPVDADKLRLQFLFGIGYGDDIDAARGIIVEEAEAHDGIMDDPGPTVRLTELGDSYVGLKSRVWISDPSRADFVKTRGEYVQSVKERFDAEDINIPYPTRTLEGDLDVQGLEVARETAGADD
jgi:small-conductance mechanosensitive channel